MLQLGVTLIGAFFRENDKLKHIGHKSKIEDREEMNRGLVTFAVFFLLGSSQRKRVREASNSNNSQSVSENESPGLRALDHPQSYPGAR